MAHPPSPAYDELVSLGRRLYELALVRREHEDITDPRGQPIGWLLDTRIPMLRGDIMREVGSVLAARLQAKGVHQVVGYGFGSYALVSSAVAAPTAEPILGGFLRESRKPHGRKRLVEGPISREHPVVFVDDILNSGRSALKAMDLLRKDGFHVEGMLCLFHFTWSGGKARLEEKGLWVDSILDLNLKQ